MTKNPEPLDFAGLLNTAFTPAPSSTQSGLLSRDDIHALMRQTWESSYARPDVEYMPLEEKRTRETLGIYTHADYLLYRLRHQPPKETR